MNPPVTPGPTPTAFTFDGAEAADGTRYVIMNVYTPTGWTVYFLEAKVCLDLANTMRATAKEAMTRISVPRNDLIVPGDN